MLIAETLAFAVFTCIGMLAVAIMWSMRTARGQKMFESDAEWHYRITRYPEQFSKGQIDAHRNWKLDRMR